MEDSGIKIMSEHDFVSLVYKQYTPDKGIGDRIKLYVTLFVGVNRNVKDSIIKLDENLFDTCIRTDIDKDSSHVPISVKNIKLRMQYHVGDIIEIDYSCDSTYMESVMRIVDAAIYQKYHWVGCENKLYFVLNNSGSHGINKYVDEYVAILKNDYNIE